MTGTNTVGGKGGSLLFSTGNKRGDSILKGTLGMEVMSISPVETLLAVMLVIFLLLVGPVSRTVPWVVR